MKRFAYDTSNNGDGRALAFGDTDNELTAQLCAAGCDPDDAAFADCTDGLAASSAELWDWLPGSGDTIACTRSECERALGL